MKVCFVRWSQEASAHAPLHGRDMNSHRIAE